MKKTVLIIFVGLFFGIGCTFIWSYASHLPRYLWARNGLIMTAGLFSLFGYIFALFGIINLEIISNFLRKINNA